MIRRPPRSTQSRSSAASDVYKRQLLEISEMEHVVTLIVLRMKDCQFASSVARSALGPITQLRDRGGLIRIVMGQRDCDLQPLSQGLGARNSVYQRISMLFLQSHPLKTNIDRLQYLKEIKNQLCYYFRSSFHKFKQMKCLMLHEQQSCSLIMLHNTLKNHVGDILLT
eukprot:TRINITY_DN5192_c0_g1_i13.p1 TRINITY_DN5192_c0_g1~~TRINITY_DN5192_c0_g1_i13.p1  ORF type:complete len:168 (+),score=14.63 TRINITY_DN5192_c0_g1_i13:97-600(+)